MRSLTLSSHAQAPGSPHCLRIVACTDLFRQLACSKPVLVGIGGQPMVLNQRRPVAWLPGWHSTCNRPPCGFVLMVLAEVALIPCMWYRDDADIELASSSVIWHLSGLMVRASHLAETSGSRFNTLQMIPWCEQPNDLKFVSYLIFEVGVLSVPVLGWFFMLFENPSLTLVGRLLQNKNMFIHSFNNNSVIANVCMCISLWQTQGFWSTCNNPMDSCWFLMDYRSESRRS
jgi:hypothetical protein